MINKDQIDLIRKETKNTVGQTDDQIATGIVISYIDRCQAKPHLSITSFAYAKSVHHADDVRLNITLTEDHWRTIENICVKKKVSRGRLLRWIIADTAERVGYPR